MSKIVHSILLMLGKDAKKPARDQFSAKALEIFKGKKTKEAVQERIRLIKEEKVWFKPGTKWLKRRWASVIIVNLLFVLSFWLDIQLIEGALTGSRVVGFHMADLNSALQVMLAYKHIVVNLLIGTATVLFGWWLLGGRTFCAWACPYHLLAEIAEMIHIRLAAKGLVKDHTFDRRMRTVLYFIFAILAFVTGYTVFEYISPVGILSRAFTYGASFALVIVGVLLLIEIFYSRRFWCRYVCPIGLTYGFAGALSPVQIKYDSTKCLHEGECRDVCMVPHVLEPTKLGFADQEFHYMGADCTRCGMCLDACPTGALKFHIRGSDSLL